MILEIRLIDDDGKDMIAPLKGSPEIPLQWKAPTGNPIIIPRAPGNGCYKLWVVTVQPQTTLDLNWRKDGTNPTRGF